MTAHLSAIRNIHIIEDSQEDYAICERYLRKNGFNKNQINWHKKFSDYQSADKSNDDFVILDLGLPDIEGGEALTSICAEGPELPVIVLTGNENTNQGINALNLGALDYLLKDEVSENQLIRSLILAKERKRIGNELENEKEKSIKKAKLATLGEFNSNMAHEINNPLTIIQGYTGRVISSLKSKAIDLDKEIGLLSRVEKTCSHIANVVKSLANYSRESTGDPFQSERVRTILDDVQYLVEAKCKSLNILLEIDKSIDYNCSFECRKSEILQVLCNLINNSCDAVKNLNERWISICVEKKARHINIFVRDSGSGIPKEIQSKIFNPHFTTKNSGEGLGLGLAITQKIIHAHAGKFQVKNSEQNTCIMVSFPYNQQTQQIKKVG